MKKFSRKNLRFKVLIGFTAVLFLLGWWSISFYIPYKNNLTAIECTLSEMQTIEGAFFSYREAYGSDPVDISSLQPHFLSLLDTESGRPIDRWHTEIIYNQATNSLVSAGIDKKFGTEDDLTY